MKEGKLPEGWEWKRLGDIGKIISGVTYIAEEARDEPEKDYIPVLRATNIQGELSFDDLVYVPSERVSDEQHLKHGDIVIAMSSGSKAIVGKTAQAKKDFHGGFGAFCAVFRCHSEVDKKYIGLFFQTSNYRTLISHLSRGANINNLRKESIRSIPLPLPPLPIQRQIVAILEQAEATKRLRAESDDLTQRFLQSIFVEMFGDPVKNEKGWGIDTIENNVTRLTNGYVGPTRDIYVDEGIPYLMAKHIKNKKVSFDNGTFVTKEFNQKHSKSILEKGDVLLVQSGAIGQSAVVKDNHVGHNCHALIVITPRRDTLDGQYLSYIFSSTAGKVFIDSIETGITLSHLNCKDVKKMKIPIPPLAIQQEFARIVEQVEALRESQRQSDGEINLLFDGLMQKAFTGELVA